MLKKTWNRVYPDGSSRWNQQNKKFPFQSKVMMEKVLKIIEIDTLSESA